MDSVWGTYDRSSHYLNAVAAPRGGWAAGARAPAVKPCAPAVPRQLSYDDVDHKRNSSLRASDSEDVNCDVITLNVTRQHGRYMVDV